MKNQKFYSIEDLSIANWILNPKDANYRGDMGQMGISWARKVVKWFKTFNACINAAKRAFSEGNLSHTDFVAYVWTLVKDKASKFAGNALSVIEAVRFDIIRKLAGTSANIQTAKYPAFSGYIRDKQNSFQPLKQKPNAGNRNNRASKARNTSERITETFATGAKYIRTSF